MFKAAVLTVSDRSFRGERPDAGGPLAVSYTHLTLPTIA